ncbi:NUDIX hydrolase [Nonomuraea muscovyensis]|uniref:NUDIX hydrolase n=1 Tax=Nonomuraea muscovyensis TaxID=1124761 RepID=UPI0033D06D8E
MTVTGSPGGVLERGEDITTGLCREVREETGLEVEAEALNGVYKNMALGIVALPVPCCGRNPDRDRRIASISVGQCRRGGSFGVRGSLG